MNRTLRIAAVDVAFGREARLPGSPREVTGVWAIAIILRGARSRASVRSPSAPGELAVADDIRDQDCRALAASSSPPAPRPFCWSSGSGRSSFSRSASSRCSPPCGLRTANAASGSPCSRSDLFADCRGAEPGCAPDERMELKKTNGWQQLAGHSDVVGHIGYR